MDQSSKLYALRHSCEHVLTMAMLRIWGNKIKAAMGPATDEGFYFDFDSEIKISEEDFPKIEKEMAKIIKENLPIIKDELTVKEARDFFNKNTYKGNEYKHEWLDEIEGRGEKVGVYWMGDKGKDIPDTFVDICAGPHAESTRKIGAFKLMTLAGAYWRGNEKNKMLQRIYGTCFETKEELFTYLKQLEEAKKRDHRKLGKELKLFTFNDYVGPGLPLWLPRGTVIVEELEKLAKKTEKEAGYQQVRTPHIAKEIMYKTSGHLPYYADSMFPPLVIEEEDGRKETYYLKAMNCPHHHQIFADHPRSYRELPLRLSEYGTCYRYEKSGELFGLMRVRMLSMNDAHIYCTEEQFSSEFKAVNDMYLKYFKLFGFEKYVMRFSTHDPKELGKKYVNEPELWKKTEDMVRKVLVDSKINFVEIPNEAAFYGPKIDVQVWSSIGREFTIATNQVDFAVPRRFGLKYIDKDNQEKTPICIHRAPLGTHERFIGFLIEHYAGAFPFWLAPEQIRILPVSDLYLEYAWALCRELRQEGYRTEIDDSAEKLGRKIRNAELMKIPLMAVVGEKEQKENSVNVRDYATKNQQTIGIKEFVESLKKL